MMDRNREARRAAAMANGLPRRRHRTTSTTGSLRDSHSPEEDGPLELQETARLRDRTVKKDRDRDIRDRDRDRDRNRDRLSRNKRRRTMDSYIHHGGSNNREDSSNVVDDSSDESVNDDEDEDEDVSGHGHVRYVPPSNPVPVSASSGASTLTSHRKSYPPPSKVFRSSPAVPVAPTWKAPDEMIGVSVPRKARSASTKRGHDCWTSGGVSGEHIHRQQSSSPVRSSMTAAATPPVPSPIPAPMSPSSSNVSIKKKPKPNGGAKHKPPKSSSCPKSSSPSIQDEIEIEVAEVLYGLMRQSQATPSNDSARELNRSTVDSKSRVSSPINASQTPVQNSSSTAQSLTVVAPKRKRPRQDPEENQAVRNSPILTVRKTETDQAAKPEDSLPGSIVEKGDFPNTDNPTKLPSDTVPSVMANGVSMEVKATVEESGRIVRAKVEEASSSPKLDSQDHNRVELASTSTKANSALPEKENHREDKFEIDLMAPPPPSRGSPEREEGNGMMGDEKVMVTDREAETKGPKPKKRANGEDDEKGVKSSSNNNRGVELNVNTAGPVEQAEPKAALEAKANCVGPSPESEAHKPHHHHQPILPAQHQQLNLNSNLQLDLEKADHKLNLQQPHKQPQPQTQTQTQTKISKDDVNADNKPGQASSVQLPMSVPGGWHGGLGPMGYVAPLQGVVSMDRSTMATPPMQPPHFVFAQPKPKRCATHCHIARSISMHQQVVKINPFWPAAAGSAPLFGAKPPYNLNMVPPPTTDLHAAAAAAGRGGMASSAQDKSQPFAFFPGQPASKDIKSQQTANVAEAAQKKQFLLPQSLPPGAPNNVMHAPAFFFPFGQQAAAAAAASARPSTTKSPSTAGTAVSTATTSSAPMGTSSTPPAAAGPAMSFSYPNMGGNETQFMAILGNGPYPFPIPAHVGAAPPYRGSHPQAMSFFNGSFYSSQMLHPSQLQQQQQQPPAAPSQSMQMQQQNHQNASLSTASSSSQKHLQNQQQRPQGSGANGPGTSNQSLQNFQAAKNRPSQPQHDMGGEDSPSTADSRNRPNMSVYGQNFAMPFHSPSFAMMTPPSSIGGGSSNAGGSANGNVGDKKQQQQQSQQPAFPMSFASMNGATTPGLDISSMAHNHAIFQSLPEASRHTYQMMAAAAQAAQAGHHKRNNYRGPDDGKTGAGGAAADSSIAEEERKAMASRAASVGQSIAFSRDLAENSAVPGNNVADSSARSLNLGQGSSRPTRSSGPNTTSNSNAGNSQQLQQQQQQQQQQMLFPKQQQFVAATVAAARSKTPATSNSSVFPDHLTSSSIMAAKFPNTLPTFPNLVQGSGAPSQSPQWKNSVRPNTSQVSSPSAATSTASTIKNLPQQQGRPQQSHTQISFGAAPSNPKPSTTSQGQQTANSNQAPSSPMIVGSPSTSSISKSAGGSPRTSTTTSAGNKTGGQASTLSNQQGKNSPSPSLSSQKPSILGSPHMMSTSSSASKPQLQDSSQHHPQLSKQSIQQAQLFFSNAAYMQASANASAGGGYYLQRHRPDNQQQHQQQQQQGQKSQGSGPPTSSSGMLSLCTPVSLANASTSDPAKAVAAAAAAAAANGMKGGLPPQGLFNAAQFAAAQSAGGTHQLVPAGFPYIHAVSTAVQAKPAEQKQPAGE